MLIGLIGSKGAGKSTVSDYLINSLFQFKSYAFANPLKRLCRDLFELRDEQLEGHLKEVVDPRWNVTPRMLYQKIGTELFRHRLKREIPDLLCDNIWIKKFEMWYETHKEGNIVVVDCRFEDEIDAIKKRGGYILCIERDLEQNDHHVSEQIYKTYPADVVIQNDNDLLSLYNKVEAALRHLQKV
mgnify:CR=1 FL=1